MDKIQRKIKELDAIDKEWEKLVISYLDQNGDTDDAVNEDVVARFFQLLDDICNEIKKSGVSEEKALAVFSEGLRYKVEKLISGRLRAYRAFEPIRQNEKTNRLQVEYLFDAIWQQYVLRYDPEMKIDALGMTDNELDEVKATLDTIAEHCISRRFSYNRNVQTIKDLTGISSELCDTIARKIESDYSKLSVNYIIKHLQIIEGR